MNCVCLISYNCEIKVSRECKELWFISKTCFYDFNNIVCSDKLLVRNMAGMCGQRDYRAIK